MFPSKFISLFLLYIKEIFQFSLPKRRETRGRKILQNPSYLSSRIVYFKVLLTAGYIVFRYCIFFFASGNIIIWIFAF